MSEIMPDRNGVILDGEDGEWTYFVSLDGDYAEECLTLEQALHVRREAYGHIKPENRKIWRTRERTEWIGWDD